MLRPLLALVLAAPAPTEPAEPPSAEPTEATASGARLERGYLRVSGIERDPLVEALVLRVPHLTFEPFESAAGSPPETMAAFVDVRREPAEAATEQVRYSLTIVVSDGRAFDRRLETSPDDEEVGRLLATTAANLLLAIEAGTVRADRGDVPLPTPAAPVCPECECPAPVTCPTTPVEPEPEPPPPIPPRIELGPVVTGWSVLGLGAPIEADRFAAAGASVGAHARLRRGAFFGVEARVTGRSEQDARITRLRMGLGAGYHYRRGPWSLGASLWGTVEPWWVGGGEIEPPPRPMWGLAVRLSPALVQPGLAGGRMTLTVGPVLELSSSASTSAAGFETGLVLVTGADRSDRYLRVGGLELSMGLTATLWFGLPRGRD